MNDVPITKENLLAAGFEAEGLGSNERFCLMVNGNRFYCQYIHGIEHWRLFKVPVWKDGISILFMRDIWNELQQISCEEGKAEIRSEMRLLLGLK